MNMKLMSFQEVQKLSKKAVRDAIVERRRILFKMRLHSKTDVKSIKPDVVRGVRKEIARLKTFYTIGRI